MLRSVLASGVDLQMCVVGGARAKVGPLTWRKDPSQGTPKTRNSTDLSHFFVRAQIHFRKKNIKITPHSRDEGAPIRELRDFSMLGPRFYTNGPL